MLKLLSLPPNITESFYELENADRKEWFCTSDPVDHKLGSGGGTTWLLEKCQWDENGNNDCFDAWTGKEKRILLHAGGESRRLPAYAPSGKILTPIPVFRWERGQKLGQNLLSLQIPLYEKIMKKAPDSIHTLVASGDVYIRTTKELAPIPHADVVCYGLWVDPTLATRHGVFVSDRNTPDRLAFMLQKPSIEELNELTERYFFLMDIGIWLLSDKAVSVLRHKCYDKDGKRVFYDLYSDFGKALGENPKIADKDINGLTVAIMPLAGGEFYHYGTSRELISSTCRIQNLVNDQREIMHKRIKPSTDLFTQNSDIRIKFTEKHKNIWIENSCIAQDMQLSEDHILTGIPENDWHLSLAPGMCIDIVPVNGTAYAARPYGIDDPFKGNPQDASTIYMKEPLAKWCNDRGLDLTELAGGCTDMQYLPLFPVCKDTDELERVLRWMLSADNSRNGKEIWLSAEKMSAGELSAKADLRRLYAQRKQYMVHNWPAIAANYKKSIFYQINLDDAAKAFAENGIKMPGQLPDDESPINLMHYHAFRKQVMKLTGQGNSAEENDKAFEVLRKTLIKTLSDNKNRPVIDVYPDQIVWGRCPVRIDLAGGWSDTPPYSLYAGGNVVNMAIELNGQPPLQVYIKPCKEHHIILRSIDMGAMEVITEFDEIKNFNKVGSAFSIPKAALALAGFHPDFCQVRYNSLEEQLKDIGGGLELTLLSAVPAGSGLGTSSILASTVLGTLSDFCKLNWDKNSIGTHTLILEQLLTTGGGWQDQYGGILHGVKLLQTEAGFNQIPQVSWLPGYIFTDPAYKDCHLLYYTGITRVAKNILSEIVESMFLNETAHLAILHDMKNHAIETFNAIQHGKFEEYGRMIGKTWEQNKALDRGTAPQSIENIISLIKDYCLGYKLPGAGGGGFLYMVAKDIESAGLIKKTLMQNRPNDKARFVDMSLSECGLKISRS